MFDLDVYQHFLELHLIFCVILDKCQNIGKLGFGLMRNQNCFTLDMNSYLNYIMNYSIFFNYL